MNNLEEFLNNKLSPEKEDAIMKRLAEIRMAGLRSSYEDKLENLHGVSKSYFKKGRQRIFFAVTIMLLALFFLTVFISQFSGDREGYSKKIASYISHNKVDNYDMTRSTVNANNEIYYEYQRGNYKKAIELWNNSEILLQDSFYVAMSHLYIHNFQKAELIFRELDQKIPVDVKFYAENQLYYALTLVLLNDSKKAIKLYESWPRDSWMSNEFKKALDIENVEEF